MSDVFDAQKRSEVMSAIKASGNKDTELAFAKILRLARITGWRRRYPLLGKPDFVFRHEKVAVFIDGCFWHRCYILKHAPLPKTRTEWWAEKFSRNQQRDRKVSTALRAKGWKVLRIWEHSLKHPERVSARVEKVLLERRKLS